MKKEGRQKGSGIFQAEAQPAQRHRGVRGEKQHEVGPPALGLEREAKPRGQPSSPA